MSTQPVIALVIAVIAVSPGCGKPARRPLPTPPPFTEMLTGEGTKNDAPIQGAGRRIQAVPSPVATLRQGSGRASGTASTARFFFEGNGRLMLSHAHFPTTLDVRYRRSDGTYDPEALQQIRHFFRSRDDGREGAVALRTIELLSYIQVRYRPRQMTLLSGYRSPEYNASLGAAGLAVAQASLHTQGLAADVAFGGIDLGRVWRQLRELRTGGAGYYRKGNFLHVDTGPARFWEETTSRVTENLSAGNARLFVRTDFDRYAGLDGAVLTLHSVTALPLLVSKRATLIGADNEADLTLEAMAGIESQDGCLAITTPHDAYQLRVATVARRQHSGRESAADRHSRIVLSTCEPRTERTPPQVESNPIDVAQ